MVGKKLGRLLNIRHTVSLGNKIILLSEEECARWNRTVQRVIDEYERRVGNKRVPGNQYVETVNELIKKYD